MRREPASGFLRVFLTVAELTEAIRWKEFLLSLYIVSGKLETLYIEQKRPSGRAFRKKDKKGERKGLTKGEGSGILTELSARSGVPAEAAAGATKKTFAKLEKRA